MSPFCFFLIFSLTEYFSFQRIGANSEHAICSSFANDFSLPCIYFRFFPIVATFCLFVSICLYLSITLLFIPSVSVPLFTRPFQTGSVEGTCDGSGFLGATKHLYNWLCPSVCLSVCWSVTHSFDDPDVAPYWPTWPCFSGFKIGLSVVDCPAHRPSIQLITLYSALS